MGFPLLLIPLAIYNIIAFLMPDVRFGEPLFKLALMSGAEWPVTLSDVLLAVGIVLLLLEIVKGARPGAKYFTDHLLSLIVFGAAAAEFVLWPKFGTSTYFLLTALALVDFLSGLSLRRRRGAVAAPAPIVEKTSGRKAEPQVAEPSPEPSAPPAASVAESVLTDHPQPTTAQPAIIPDAASPEVPSPGLQPGSGAQPSPDSPPR
jgi:hypothetical protein